METIIVYFCLDYSQAWWVDYVQVLGYPQHHDVLSVTLKLFVFVYYFPYLINGFPESLSVGVAFFWAFFWDEQVKIGKLSKVKLKRLSPHVQQAERSPPKTILSELRGCYSIPNTLSQVTLLSEKVGSLADGCKCACVQTKGLDRNLQFDCQDFLWNILVYSADVPSVVTTLIVTCGVGRSLVKVNIAVTPSSSSPSAGSTVQGVSTPFK